MDPTDQQWTIIEPLFEEKRRLVTRWERHVENFMAMLQLGCMRILFHRL